MHVIWIMPHPSNIASVISPVTSNVTSQSFTVSSKETTVSNHTGLPYPRQHLDKLIDKCVPLDLKSEEGKRF